MADTQTAEAEATQQQAPPAGDNSVQVQEAELPESTDQPSGGGIGQIDLLLESVMSVSVQLGQVDMQVRELLQLSSGSVLKLDRQVGEPVDVFLRGTKFATGQLVVVGDRLGVRVKEILSQTPDQDSEEQNGNNQQ